MWRLKDKTLHGIEAEKIRRNAGIYTILTAALLAMTFFGVCDPRSTSRFGGGLSGSAGSVGRDTISRAEFQRAYRNTYDRYQRMYGEAFDPGSLRLATVVMRQLVDEHGLYQWSKGLGLAASDDEVLSVLAQENVFKDDKGQFSEEQFSQYLRNQGYSEASFLEEIRRNFTVQKLRRFVTNTTYVPAKVAELDYRVAETKTNLSYIKVDPQKLSVVITTTDVDQFLSADTGKQKVKDYFEQNTREFNQPEKVRARHVLVAFKGARSAVPAAANREKDQARKMAADILTKAKSGADFAALAKEHTDEPSGKTSGGDLGLFTRDKMDKAFSDAAFALGVGQISDLVETPFGFHIIKVEEKQAAVAKALETVEKDIAMTLLTREKRPVLAKELADKVAAAMTGGQEKSDKEGVQLLTANGLTWADTGEFNGEARFVQGVGSSADLGDVLTQLKKPGQVYSKPVDIRGNLFVFKLKSRVEPDLTKLDSDRTRELKMMSAYTEGNALFSDYDQMVRADLEKNKDVWMNPEYLALDDRGQKDQEGAPGD